MNYGLNSLKGGYMGDYMGDYYRGHEGDTRSLDYSSYDPMGFHESWTAVASFLSQRVHVPNN